MTLAPAVPDPAFDSSDTVARLLGHVVAVHAHAVVLGCASAHDNETDAVHEMRVSTRRLRSALATGRPFLDRTVTEPIRDELGWLADVLGAARDAEVRCARIGEAVDALVSERSDLDWEPHLVRPALMAPLQQRHDEALAALRAALESGRYAELAGVLDVLAADPPWTRRAGQRVGGAYRRRVRGELLRLDGRMRAAAVPGLDADTRAHALHEARKAVKRTRYAVAPLGPVYGKRADKLATRLKDLQLQLGQLQDTVITRTYLHSLVLSEQQHVEPPVALAAGALIEREAAHAETYEQAALHAWHRVTKVKPLR